MEITQTSESTWAVESTSGNTYTVTYCGSGDGDPDVVRLWSCDCPAATYRGGLCKHIKAVIETIDDEA